MFRLAADRFNQNRIQTSEIINPKKYIGQLVFLGGAGAIGVVQALDYCSSHAESMMESEERFGRRVQEICSL